MHITTSRHTRWRLQTAIFVPTIKNPTEIQFTAREKQEKHHIYTLEGLEEDFVLFLLAEIFRKYKTLFRGGTRKTNRFQPWIQTSAKTSHKTQHWHLLFNFNSKNLAKWSLLQYQMSQWRYYHNIYLNWWSHDHSYHQNQSVSTPQC